MSKKYRAMSLIMASVIGATSMPLLTETVVMASSIKANTSINVEKVAVEKSGKLSKGDRFDIKIYVKTDMKQVSENGEIGLDRTEFKPVKGASGSGVKASWYQYQDDQLGVVQVAELKGLTFKGDSTAIEIEMWHPNLSGDKTVLASVTLDPNEVDLNASSGEAIKLVQNTVNVVAGETQQIRVTLENKLTVPSEKGKVKFTIADKEVAKKITIKTKEVDVPEMQPGEKRDIVVNLDISEELARGVYDLTVDIGGTSQVVKLKSDSNFMPPALEVNLQTTPDLETNKSQDVVIAIKNVGHIAAKNVTATLTGEGVVVTNGSNKKHVGNIESNKSVQLPATLMVIDKDKLIVPLTVEFKFIDDEGKEHTSSHVLNIPTKAATTSSQKEITVTLTKQPTSTMKPEQTFDVGFSVTAPDGVKDLKIELESSEGIVNITKSLFYEPVLSKGQKKAYNVSFKALTSVTTGTYPVAIKASYTLNGEKIEAKTYATVQVNNDKKDDTGSDEDDKKTGQPKVIIGTYETNPRVVKAGEEFTLDIEFVNTHSTQSVSNLKANLSVQEKGENDTGSVFTPVNSSNTFFITHLAPGQSVKKSITMYTLPNAKSKTYEVNFDMSYDNEKGDAVKETEFIGIPVAQVTKLDIAEITVEAVEVHSYADMNAKIYNTGKTDVSNIMVKIEGEGFDIQDGTLFKGSFAKGSELLFNPTIIPLQEGILEGELVITYEDISGLPQEIREPFSFEAYPQMVMPEIGPDSMIDENGNIIEPGKEEGKSGLPKVVGIVAGGGVIAGLAVFLKKRKKKKQEDEMMDDED